MSESGFVLIIGESAAGELPDSGALPQCPIIMAKAVNTVDCPDCAVIIGEGAEIPLVKRAAGVIINGDSGGLLPIERLTGVQVITCGRCAKNTVCVTSNAGETLTLALNRGITTLSGICEPMELPVQSPNAASEYDCMAAFAAAALLGKI